MGPAQRVVSASVEKRQDQILEKRIGHPPFPVVVRLITGRGKRKNTFSSRSAGGTLIAASSLLQNGATSRESSYSSFDDAIEAGESTRGWYRLLARGLMRIHIIYDPLAEDMVAFEFLSG